MNETDRCSFANFASRSHPHLTRQIDEIADMPVPTAYACTDHESLDLDDRRFLIRFARSIRATL